jgi:hypothetical protein
MLSGHNEEDEYQNEKGELHGLKNEKASSTVSPGRRVKFSHTGDCRTGNFIDMLVAWIAPAHAFEPSNGYGANKSSHNSSKQLIVHLNALRNNLPQAYTWCGNSFQRAWVSCEIGNLIVPTRFESGVLIRSWEVSPFTEHLVQVTM